MRLELGHGLSVVETDRRERLISGGSESVCHLSANGLPVQGLPQTQSRRGFGKNIFLDKKTLDKFQADEYKA